MSTELIPHPKLHTKPHRDRILLPTFSSVIIVAVTLIFFRPQSLGFNEPSGIPPSAFVRSVVAIEAVKGCGENNSTANGSSNTGTQRCAGVKCPPNSDCKLDSRNKTKCVCRKGFLLKARKCVATVTNGTTTGVGSGIAKKNPPPKRRKSPPPPKRKSPPPPSSVVTTGVPPLQVPVKDYLDGHNRARAAIGVQPLIWNASIANGPALKWANELKRRYGCNTLEHGGMVGDMGQNLFLTCCLPDNLFAREAVSSWIDEGKDYKRAIFPGGCQTGDWADCGHYTQAVWRNTKSLGCAAARCSNQGTIVVCDYYPSGNYEGEFPY